MATVKVDIKIETTLLAELDQLVAQHVFPSRDKAIQEAVKDKIAGVHRSQLARECAKLDPREEKAIAEEGMALERNQGIDRATLAVRYVFEE